MIEKKITELNNLESLNDDDLFVVVDVETNGNETKKITGLNLQEYFGTASKDIYIGNVEDAPAEAKIVIDQQEIQPAISLSEAIGWNYGQETWEYVSVDNPTGVIKTNGDVRSRYSLGIKIKMTNNSNIIYGFVTKLDFDGTNTFLTFLHEINPSTNQALYLLNNSTISAFYYSFMKSPLGFPSNPKSWSIKVTIASGSQSNPSTNVWYNISDVTVNFPIGTWYVNYKIMLKSTKSVSTDFTTCYFSLSTSKTATSNDEFTSIQGTKLTNDIYCVLSLQTVLQVNTKTPYYAICKTDQANATIIQYASWVGTSFIELRCAYL